MLHPAKESYKFSLNIKISLFDATNFVWLEITGSLILFESSKTGTEDPSLQSSAVAKYVYSWLIFVLKVQETISSEIRPYYATPTRPKAIVLQEGCEGTLHRKSFVRENRPGTLP